MKNNNTKNFTKLTQKRGVSLIVLIVTIIVIIILAAVVILAIDKNNPVEGAREAAFKENVRGFQDELALSISKDYTIKAGQRDTKFNATIFEEIQNYIPSFREKYEGKFKIKEDELVYVEYKVNENEKKWLTTLNVRSESMAEKVIENVEEYYGKRITNYSANGVDEWKIFHSDGNNIYIIASDYVDVSKLPETVAGNKPENTDSDYLKTASFDNVVSDYEGSSNITDEKIKALNNDYFSKGYTSSEYNMKAVAYMLDAGIWSSFKTEKADYAIGGPTIEMIMASYNKSHNVNYIAKATSNIGYKISRDGGVNFKSYYGEMLSTSDSLYVLQNSNEARAMWVASPSDFYYNTNYVMYIGCNGNVVNRDYYTYPCGFRPVVCLKADIELEEDGDGYKIK